MACVAYGCKSHTSLKTDDNIRLSFHRFPEDDKLKQLWIKAIHRQNWKPTQHSRICSKHFAASCYRGGKLRKLLSRDAVPTIFENYPSYLQKESSKIARNRIIDSQRNLSVLKRHQRSVTPELGQPSTSRGLFASGIASRPLSVPRIDNTPRKKALKKIIIKLANTSARRLKKLRALQQLCRRLKRKVVTLETIINALQEKSFIDDESARIIIIE